MKKERVEALNTLLNTNKTLSFQWDEDTNTCTVFIPDKDQSYTDEQDYLVLTDDEADKAWEDGLDGYIDEIIIPELPEAYRYYFDADKWKNDAKSDGRGHTLARYDGNEEEVEVNGTTYYIYRVN